MPLPTSYRWLSLAFAGLFILLATAFRLPAEESPFQRIVKSLVRFYGTTLPEKAYLHLDRAFYASGETIWFAAYVVEADSHRPDTLSKVLYVDLLSARRGIVARRTLRLHGGLAPGDIALPDTLPAGTYQLRAYTSWMRNAGAAFFFTRSLVVAGASSPAVVAGATGRAKIDVQFFPEGGNLVETLESEVGFKAVDGQGHGVSVRGTVLDAQNRTVASFSSRHLGMGSFRLTPAPGQQYRALLTQPGGEKAAFPLPVSQPAGYSLHVSETADDFAVIVRRHGATGAMPAGPALLLAQVRGKVVFAAPAPISGAAPVLARLPKAKLPPGLVHITLFDEQGAAQCERLVFVPNPPGVRLTLTPDQPTYAPREAVHLHLQATDAAGQPVAGQFSVAVAAQNPVGADGPTIISQLLLNSDLAGIIEDPGYYFREPQLPETRQALNDLLLTQGWRRFVWKELLAGQLPGREYALEQGLSVSGQVIGPTQQPAAAHQVAYLQLNPTREAQMPTDAAGRFLFRGLDGLDTAQVMLRAVPGKGEQALTIRLLAPPPGEKLIPDPQLAASSAAILAEHLRRSQQQRALEKHYLLTAGKSIQLGNVSVRAKRVEAPADDNVRSYSSRNAVVLQVGDRIKSSDSRTVMQYLQGRVAGVTVTGGHINIRQASFLQDQSTGGFKLIEPLYLIDGNQVSADVFAAFPIQEAQTVDILNQNAALMFGMQAYGGVVAIYSRHTGLSYSTDPKDKFTGPRTGVLSAQVPSYYRAREFYAPRYVAATPAPEPDSRYATLYWTPEVHTDAAGQAQVSFYTADATGTFQATAEGLSAQGTPMHGTATLVVKARAAK